MLNFEKLCEELLSEMPVTSKLSAKDLGRRIMDRIPPGLTSGHFSPLQKLTDPVVRQAVIDAIIQATFKEKENTYSSTIHSKIDFKEAIKQAMLSVNGTNGFKVNNTSAGFLADRLWTHLQDVLEFTAEESAPKQKVEQKVAQAVDAVAKEEPPKENNVEQSQAREEAPNMDEAPAEMAPPEVDEVDPDKEISIPEEYFERLQNDIADINKRNARYSLPEVTLTKIKEEIKPDETIHDSEYGRPSADDIKPMLKFVTFKLNIPKLQLEGDWEFIARVDHEQVGNIIVRVPDSSYKGDLHKLFGSSKASVCDHCGMTRSRTSTFVVKDSKGALKRVGKMCLRDYLPGGVNAAAKLERFARYIQDIYAGLVAIEASESSGGDGERRSSRGSYYSVENIVATTLAIIDLVGYVSNKAATNSLFNSDVTKESTSSLVKEYLATLFLHKRDDQSERLKETLQDYEKMKPYTEQASKFQTWAVEHVKQELAKPNNPMADYYRNLDLILGASKPERSSADSFVNIKKHAGYVIALVNRYKKSLEEEVKAKVTADKKPSEHIGIVGLPIGELSAADKRKMKDSSVDVSKFPYNGPIKVTITANSTIERQAYSYYDTGVSYRIGMVDEQGNVYTYFATRPADLEIGDKTTIVRAGVKKHTDFKGTKQTLLTRVTFGDREVKESIEEEPLTFAEHFWECKGF